MLVLGVDGGGTKTNAWIADCEPQVGLPRLKVIGKGKSGPSNPRSVGFETAFENLRMAIDAARVQVSSLSTPIRVACLSLAGAGRRDEQSKLIEWAHSRSLAQHIVVVDDVEPLELAAEYEANAATNSEPCDARRWSQSITLVAGTGSIACGKNMRLERARVGGWGYLLGDEGSGFSIGLSGLQSVCRAHDGNGPKTSLSKSLLSELELQETTQLVQFIYQTPLPRDRIAKLAGVVIESATSDEVAAGIVETAIDSLADLVQALMQRLCLLPMEYSLGLSGGVLVHHPRIVQQLMARLQVRESSPNVYQLVSEPTYGAVLVAARAAISEGRSN
jgi:N-acetylglucosamine kinase-like BadF-type ATPase